MQIPEEVIERIKLENDIVDVISETVRLKKSGRNYIGLCPFHHEKTPSFSVSSDKQIYKCFGCGEAGNVISFVMKTKNWGFIDALKYLAERANIDLDFDDNKGSNKYKEKKEIIYNINVEAARFFFGNLKKDKNASDYFARRGIIQKTINNFGLGYSPNDWKTLLFYLKRKGYSEELIIESGLAIKSEKGTIYDRFRNRVMFPVFDYRGKVIGFGGRVLDDSKPKYLNSPETVVFNKGYNLYGLNFAIKNVIKDRTLIIVEGYMDCISLHQHGITNVVASLGTALTENQAKLMKRYADKIVISYDADTAGQNATLRGLEILRKVGLDVRVLTVPQGKDPDEFVRNNGKDAFDKLVETAKSLIDYRLEKSQSGIDFHSNDDLIEYGKRVTEILADLNPVEKDVYIKKICEDTGLREQSIYDMLSNEMSKSQANPNDMYFMPKDGLKLHIEPAYVKGERSILKLMTYDDYYNKIVDNICEDDFAMKSHIEIFNIIKQLQSENANDIENKIENRCQTPELLKEWIQIKDMMIIINQSSIMDEIRDYIYQIKKYKLEEAKNLIIRKIKDCEKQNLFQESLRLVKEKKQIELRLKQLDKS